MWKHSAGIKPHTVTVFEREAGGMLYARVWDGSARNGKGSTIRISLGHRDKQKAKRYATVEAAKLEEGKASIADGKVTLAQVFAVYKQYQTPKKTPQHQREDARRMELWLRVLGNIDPYSLTKAQWESFIVARTSGAIDARGNAVPVEKRKPLRARPVEMDCIWLRAVFNFAVDWKTGEDKYLMRVTPIRGLEFPKEKNIRRPVATADRFDAVRAISDTHMMWVGKSGKLTRVRSYLTELLDIVEGTGRRISAICALRLRDLRLEKTKEAPYGAIVWPADTDKMGYETTAPISPSVRAAIERMLQGRTVIGDVPLFPSCEDSTKPLTRHTVDKWLVEGERLAGLEKQKGGLWHPYRRKWATERKHLPTADVAAAGGWKEQRTLELYQQPDAQTILSVVMFDGKLREVREG
jgi:integrase